METIQKGLQPFPVQLSLTVQWGDMDAAQHVNNLIYLRWSETARIAYFSKLGYEVIDGGDAPGFILGYQDCKYLFPITFPDTVVIGVRTLDIGTDRFNLQCHIYSQRHQRLAAISHNRIVTFDYQKKTKVEVPELMKQRIAVLEGWPQS
ncbi:MAG: thioesterase family protein [Bacteroidota bacterium]